MIYIFYSFYIIYIYIFIRKILLNSNHIYKDNFGVYKKSSLYFVYNINIYFYIFFLFLFIFYFFIYFNLFISINFIYYYCYINSILVRCFLRYFVENQIFDIEESYIYFFNNLYVFIIFIHYNFCGLCFFLFMFLFEIFLKKKKKFNNKFINFFFFFKKT